MKAKVVWQTEEKNRKSSVQALACALFMCVASGLLILSANFLAGDFFGELLGEKPLLPTILLILNASVLILINELFLVRKSRRSQLGGNALLLVGVGVELLLFFGGRWDAIQGGTDELFAIFARKWKDYYEGGWSALARNAGANGLALQFWLIVLSALVLAAVYCLRKRKWLIVLPGIFICMLLLVGLKPAWTGLFLLFVGTVMVCCLDSSSRLRIGTAILAVLISIISILAAWVYFREEAEQVTTYYDKFIDFQEQLETNIKNFSWKNLFADIDRVDNHKPEFAEEEVLLLEMDQKPRGNIYLRGYHCVRYESGTWKKEDGTYAKQLRKTGFAEEKGVELLLQQPYKGSCASGGNGNGKVNYNMHYSGLHNKHTYLPYGTLPTAEELKVNGDYDITKAKGLDSISVTGGSYPANLEKAVNLQALSQEESTFFHWYNAYVKDQYLQVPKNQQEVRNLANQIATDYREPLNRLLEAEEEAQAESIAQPEKEAQAESIAQPEKEAQSKRAARSEEINRIRIALAESVQKKLRSIATYSLELDALPLGTDAVEYFLSESKRGYCMHFASAGTMILRQLGIPARYVSGYVVEDHRVFKRTDGYFVTVKDSDAHAWVEIYLEDYGWVVVDMTPGFSQDLGIRTDLLASSADSPGQNSEKDKENKDNSERGTTPEKEPDPDMLPDHAEGSADKKITTVEEALQVMDSNRDGHLSDEEIADFVTKNNSIWEDLEALSQANRQQESEGGNGKQENNQWGLDAEQEDASAVGESAVGGADRNTDITVRRSQGQIQELEKMLELRKILLAKKQQQELQRKVIHYLVLGVTLIVLIAIVIVVKRILNRKRFIKERRIARYLEEQHTVKGVQLINKEIYHYLCNKKARRERPENDSDYLKALKEVFGEITETEWENYFAIVQRAMYSTQEISEAEGALCHAIYSRIRQSTKA